MLTTTQPDAVERARPIEDYGLLGDTRTAALVGSDGAIVAGVGRQGPQPRLTRHV
jgi:hypothetical protein